MPEKAGQFVIALSQDPALKERFEADPDAVMTEYGLSEADRAVFNSGDTERIKQYLGSDGPTANLLVKGWTDE